MSFLWKFPWPLVFFHPRLSLGFLGLSPYLQYLINAHQCTEDRKLILVIIWYLPEAKINATLQITGSGVYQIYIWWLFHEFSSRMNSSHGFVRQLRCTKCLDQYINNRDIMGTLLSHRLVCVSEPFAVFRRRFKFMRFCSGSCSNLGILMHLFAVKMHGCLRARGRFQMYTLALVPFVESNSFKCIGSVSALWTVIVDVWSQAWGFVTVQ